MPLPLILAIVLAFGVGIPSEEGPLSKTDLIRRTMEAAAGIGVLGAWALGLGILVRTLRKRGASRSRLSHQIYPYGAKLLLILGLAIYGWTLSSLDWMRVVRWGWNLRGIAILEQFAILFPFLAGQIVVWSASYLAESALSRSIADQGFFPFLARRLRQSCGMILPVACLYYASKEMVSRGLWGEAESPSVQMLVSGVAGLLIFVLSPLFVRMSWPTKRMPDGLLRTRLERLSRRLGFRYSDLLIWDTGGQIVNAGVTGAVPWFRYVLITDAMIESLDDHEIEAVFGHEVGHIAHGHLPYFAMFCIGSIGVLTLGSEGLAYLWDFEAAIVRLTPNSFIADLIQGSIAVAILTLYFYFVFGTVSQWFERQADLYGSRAVSCGNRECPPHLDPNEEGSPQVPLGTTCPAGIDLFVSALSQVAVIHGVVPTARSWRHGSIANRVNFLISVSRQPELELQFNSRISWLKWGIGVMLGLGTTAALVFFSS